MNETTKSIGEWAAATFGESGSNLRVATRANEEMAELLRLLAGGGWTAEDVVEECADVVIVLHRLVFRCGGDLREAVEKKMAINRGREWKLDGSGHGYHV